MPVLGYGQVSGIAPGLFQDAGDSIVAGIRRTGQEIRTNLRQIQTNKQLNAFGQEAATLDPAAPNFATSLMGLAGKYPLAAGSEAGQTMVGLLASANKNAMGLEMDARNFNQQAARDLRLHKYQMEENKSKPSSLTGQYRRVPGLGIVDVLSGETIAAEPGKTKTLNEGQSLVDENGNVIVAPRDRTTATPYRFGGGVVGNAATGEFEPLPLTPFQEGTLMQRGDAAALNQSKAAIMGLQGDIARLVQEDGILSQEAAKTEDTQRKIAIQARREDIARRVDRNRSELDTLMRVTADIPLQGPSAGANNPLAPRVLGGLNPPPIAVDPMVSGAPVPQIGGGSVLPPAGAIPSTRKNSGPSWQKYLPAP